MYGTCVGSNSNSPSRSSTTRALSAITQAVPPTTSPTEPLPTQQAESKSGNEAPQSEPESSSKIENSPPASSISSSEFSIHITSASSTSSFKSALPITSADIKTSASINDNLQATPLHSELSESTGSSVRLTPPGALSSPQEAATFPGSPASTSLV